MAYDPRERGTSSRQALCSHPRRVHHSTLVPQHLVGRVDGNRPSLNLVGQQELQDLMVHALPGHVDGTTPSAVVQLQVGAVKEEEPGCVIAAMDGREEERRLTLTENESQI